MIDRIMTAPLLKGEDSDCDNKPDGIAPREDHFFKAEGFAGFFLGTNSYIDFRHLGLYLSGMKWFSAEVCKITNSLLSAFFGSQPAW